MNIRRALPLIIGFTVALSPAWAEAPKNLRGDRQPGSVRALDLVARPTNAAQPVAPSANRGGSQDLYVSTSGDNVTADGTVGLPYATIQAALFGAFDGDRVRVLAGTYNECIDTTSMTLGSAKNIEIVSDDWIVNGLRTTTVIDGTGQCESPFSVVNLAGGPGTATTTRLEGFTVTGGSASGVFALGSVAVTNNIINNNTSTFGGGVYVYPGTCFYGPTTMTISDNQVTNNTANSQGLCNPGNTPCSTSANCSTGATCDILGGDGGGIYVFGASVNSGGTIGCLGGDATVSLEDNLVDGNFADNAFGGGLYVLTNTQSLRTANVAVTSNIISNNQTLPLSAGYGGGAWMSTYGYGTETIDFVDNNVSNNTSTGDGGGLSAWIDSLNDANHQINVANNTVQLNNAEGAGGGMDLFVFGRDIGVGDSIELNASGNTVLSNSAQGDSLTSLYPGLGGGIIANVWSQRGLTPTLDLNVTGNDVRGNDATIGGGGIAVIATADADPDLNGATGQAVADATVYNNLIGVNDAVDNSGGNAVGGGIFAYLEAFGESVSTIDLSLNTIDTNASDAGSGGIEIENHTLLDTNGAMEGTAELTIDNSIISFNSGFGVGGPGAGIPGTLTPGTGTANFNRIFDYNSLFSNTDGDYEATFLPGANNDIFVDPLLDNNFRATACSPTIDSADPTLNFANEPLPNGARANLGHTGGLNIAAQSLADGNGDGAVDGLDIVRLSVAFNSLRVINDPRYDASVDFNDDGVIDGVDLALMAADFAVSCP